MDRNLSLKFLKDGVFVTQLMSHFWSWDFILVSLKSYALVLEVSWLLISNSAQSQTDKTVMLLP